MAPSQQRGNSHVAFVTLLRRLHATCLFSLLCLPRLQKFMYPTSATSPACERTMRLLGIICTITFQKQDGCYRSPNNISSQQFLENFRAQISLFFDILCVE